jgi:PAS domain S-box-containing protein
MLDQVLQALANVADGVCGVDHEQRIVFWNTAAERLMGYRAAEVSGKTCDAVFQGKVRPGCRECEPSCEVLRSASQGHPTPAYNLLSQTKDGKAIMLNVTVIVLPGAESALATLHLFRDITHQLQYETYVEHILRGAARLPPPQTTLHRKMSASSPLPASLTAREHEVLELLVQGMATRDIATTLELSYATVRNYVQSILRKCGAHSQRAVIRLALEQRLV